MSYPDCKVLTDVFMVSYSPPFRYLFALYEPCLTYFFFTVSRYSALFCLLWSRGVKSESPSFWLYRAKDQWCVGMPYSLTDTVTWSPTFLYLFIYTVSTPVLVHKRLTVDIYIKCKTKNILYFGKCVCLFSSLVSLEPLKWVWATYLVIDCVICT